MANRYWVGGGGTWTSNLDSAHWSTAPALALASASCSGTTLTTTGSPALVVGMTVWSSTNVSLGTVTGGSVNTWTVSTGGTYASQNMTAATVGASVPTSVDNVFFGATSSGSAYTVGVINASGGSGPTCADFTAVGATGGTVTFSTVSTTDFNVYGSWSTASTGVVINLSTGSRLNFLATTTGKTISTSNIAIPPQIIFNGVGGGWTLGSNLSNTAGTTNITVTAGAFSTGNFTINGTGISSNGSGTRSISFGSSTINLDGAAPISISGSNLTLNAGTSTINCSGTALVFTGGGQTFNNVNFTSTAITTASITGANTFNNLSITGLIAAGIANISFSANQTIAGTLTLSAGTDATMRTFVQSNTIGTTRTLTCAAVAALTDIDFRDISIAGAAISGGNLTGTRLGDCKGNSGITFGAGTIKYWNLLAGGNWSAIGWATAAGNTPAVNNFPLAQDTAIFQSTRLNSGSIISVNANYNIGTIDMSARTSNTMTLSTGTTTPTIYGNWINGTGTTLTGTGNITFAGRGSQTITSTSKTFTQSIEINSPSGSTTLQDAFVSSRSISAAITLTAGTFDANGYNVTLSGAVSGVASSNSNTRTIAIGSGTWTISGTGGWNASTATNLTVTGTGTISLTNAAAKTFAGGNASYSGITLNQGGAGTLTISGSNTFADITNTYSATGATTIFFTGGSTTTLANFTASGSATNTLTLGSTVAPAATLSKTTGGVVNVPYISVSYITGTVSGTLDSQPVTWKFFNSTDGGNNTNLIFAFYLYWIGSNATWDTVTSANWSTISGGGGSSSIPTANDYVYFDQAGPYTVSLTGALTCYNIAVSGASVTFADGTSPTLAISGSMSLAATTVWNSTAAITFNSTLTGQTITTNGVSIAPTGGITFNGIGGYWTLGSALTTTGTITLTNGTFDTGNYAISAPILSSSNTNTRTIKLGSSAVTLTSSTPVVFTTSTGLTLNAGTSTINCSATTPTFNGGGLTFYNVNFTATTASSTIISGANTFNNLTIAGRTGVGVNPVQLTSNQTINGTLTLSAGTTAAMRTFVQSDIVGTTRTLTCAAVASLTDIDFRDITIAGAAISGSNLTGTRLGDCKGNSAITFPTAKTVYFRTAASASWGVASTGSWSLTSNGALDATAFPLAQDTAVFPSSPTAYPTSGNTVTINAAYNIGTVDMSARTTNTMTLATGTTTPTIYGNWINGTGTTLTGTGMLTFAGRGSQTITSASKTFTQPFTINSPSGSVTLQDAFSTSRGISGGDIILSAGSFSDGGYNLTLTATGTTGGFTVNSSGGTKTVTINGSWSIANSGNTFVNQTSTNLTVTGTGTISLTSASDKTFAGGSITYSGITLNQSGAGALIITGSNTFNNITNTYSATGATSILFTAATTNTFTNWNASGTAGNLLTISSVTAATHTLSKSSDIVSADYLSLTNSIATGGATWYAGVNSTNVSGNTGWLFTSPSLSNSNMFLVF